jgi:hypothetical protein
LVNVPADPQKLVYDFLGSFPQGMNSGVDPLLLPRAQLAYAQNGTVRGDFFLQRPACQTINLSYANSAAQNNFQTGLFQGAGYYQPDSGAQSVMALVAGHLFQIIPDQSGNATITDLSIPGNLNPANVTQAWMFQAENYLICNDGVTAPLIYNGTTAFRSNNGQQTLLGVVGTSFTVPAVGSDVNVTLQNPFLGTPGQTILIGEATYQVVAPIGTFQANLTNENDSSGATYPIGTNIIQNPNVLFYTGPTQFASVIVASAAIAPGANVGNLSISTLVNYTGAIGATLVWGGITWQVLGWVDTAGVQHGGGIEGSNILPYVIISNTQTVPQGWSQTISPFQAFYTSGSNLPNVTVATLSLMMTAPGLNATITVTIATGYTGPANQPVQIGQFLYTITALVPTSSGATITVENENDTPLNTVTAPTNVYSIPQLPAGRMGTYGMGRIWLSLPDGLSFIAGDIVGGQSGSLQNNFRDAVLNITENEYLAGGGTFRVPGTVGSIQAMQFIALLDASLGQGPLQVFTNQTVFGCQAPVDRSTWQSLTNPILGESLIGSGGISQDACSLANGDLLFRSGDGTARSLLMARLDFNRWGNTPVSREMQRVLQLENLSLLSFDSAVVFDNRWLLAAMPTQALRGVYFTSILALNFDPLSSLREKQQSVWDGEWTGLNVLKLVAGWFNGVRRCFALCLGTDLTQIELHEILPTGAANYDNGSIPIPAYFESPVLDFGDRKAGTHNFKRLDYGEIYLDSLVGPVQFQAFYKPDKWPAWVPWYSWTQSYSQPSTLNPPPAPDPGFRPRVGLPTPDGTVFDPVNSRPLREGYSFQFKLIGTGPFRFLGARLEAIVIHETKRAPPVDPLF